MSYPGERVCGDCFGLPENFLVSWVRCNDGDGIRWTLWDGDEKVADFALGDAIDRMVDGRSFGKDARQMFWDLAEEHLSKQWDRRIAGAQRALAAPAPLALPAAIDRREA